jgi:hypothetical protein
MGTEDCELGMHQWTTSVTTHPNDTILSAFGSPYQTSQEVTHPGIALAEARLTAEF